MTTPPPTARVNIPDSEIYLVNTSGENFQVCECFRGKVNLRCDRYESVEGEPLCPDSKEVKAALRTLHVPKIFGNFSYLGSYLTFLSDFRSAADKDAKIGLLNNLYDGVSKSEIGYGLFISPSVVSILTDGAEDLRVKMAAAGLLRKIETAGFLKRAANIASVPYDKLRKYIQVLSGALPNLSMGLSDPDLKIRELALLMMIVQAADYASLVPRLLNCQYENPQYATLVGTILNTLNKNSLKLGLLVALKDPNPEVRLLAINKLYVFYSLSRRDARLYKWTDSDLQALVQLKMDPVYKVRAMANIVVSRIFSNL